MKTIVISTIAIFAIVIGLGLYSKSQQPAKIIVNADEALTITAEDHVVGVRDAKVVLVEYSDLQCPACGAYYPLIKQVKEEYSDRIAVVTRHFPLSFHLQARPAAYSLEAASNQGKFLEMLDKIFTTQDAWSNKPTAQATFDSYAQELGLDMDQFESDRKKDAVKARVDMDVASGTALRVNATPTFILQGERIQPRTVEDFKRFIDKELEKTSATVESADVEN